MFFFDYIIVPFSTLQYVISIRLLQYRWILRQQGCSSKVRLCGPGMFGFFGRDSGFVILFHGI